MEDYVQVIEQIMSVSGPRTCVVASFSDMEKAVAALRTLTFARAQDKNIGFRDGVRCEYFRSVDGILWVVGGDLSEFEVSEVRLAVNERGQILQVHRKRGPINSAPAQSGGSRADADGSKWWRFWRKL